MGLSAKKESTIFSDGAFLERATRLELASRHPANGHCHSREPCLTSYDFTRCAQVETASSRGCLQKKKAPSSQMVLFWSGRRGSNSLPGIPRMAMAIRGSPASPRMISRAARRSRQRVLGAVCKKKKAPSSQMVLFWSGRRGSNSLPRPWQGRALPDELRPQTQDRL